MTKAYTCETCNTVFEKKTELSKHVKKSACSTATTTTAAKDEHKVNLAVVFKYCLDVLRNNEHLTGDKALRTLAHLLDLRLIESQFNISIDIALRTEIHDGTKKQFWLQNAANQTCENCKEKTDKLATDHYPISYKQILDSFLASENLENHLSTLQVYETQDNELRLVDRDFAKRWLTFHDERATYRLLCKSCNSSFGCYDYKKP